MNFENKTNTQTLHVKEMFVNVYFIIYNYNNIIKIYVIHVIYR